jgi:crotonobetainyl-CoA:carnitine CoA-transferase CaiB-like acyl-CoA transferase
MDLLAKHTYTVRSFGAAAAYTAWLLEKFGANLDHQTALEPEGLGAFLAREATHARAPELTPGRGSRFITDAPVNDTNRDLISRIAATMPVVWITPWGIDSTIAEAAATDLLLHAAGGWMSAVGEPGREPLGPPDAQGRFTAGLYGAIAAIAPDVFDAYNSNGITDVAVVESIAATMIYDVVTHQMHGPVRQRAGNRFSRPNCTLVTLPCKDGHVGLHIALYRQWLAACTLIGHPELPYDPRFADPLERMGNTADLDEQYLLPWLAERTRWEVYHQFQAARIPASALPTVDEVLASPHLAARKSFVSVVAPGGTRLQVPGAPARIIAEQVGSEKARLDGPWRPGAIRVVDLSMGWAGPLVSQILASYGADVIKIEGSTHFDWWRGSRPPGDDPGLALHEKSPVFCTANRGKRGVTFDLTTEEGHRNALRLIEGADVVVENYAAGVLERLGLTYEAVSKNNPGLIMLRQPGFGSSGPEAGYVAFGNTIEGMSGLTSLMGYENGPPTMMSNAFGDPISGLNGVVAVLAALAARKQDGKGRLIEASQLEGFLPLVSEALIDYQRSGRLPSRKGNRRAGSAPSGLFPCAGDDTWIAIEADSDAAWAALAGEIGLPWAAEPSLTTLAGREAGRDSIEKDLAKWTATMDRDELAARLAAAGCPAAPLNSEPDLLAFDVLLDREFYQPLERAFIGTLLYPSLPIRKEFERPATALPAPTLGQHTDEVLAAMGVGTGRPASGDTP